MIIAVPHYSHPDLAIRAMEYGKHIIVEKPIAVHKAEAERMLAAAKKYPGLKKSAMFNQRTIPAHRKIKQMIDSGELGKIMRVNWIITDWFRSQCYYDSGDWRASWRGEGGQERVGVGEGKNFDADVSAFSREKTERRHRSFSPFPGSHLPMLGTEFL